MKEILRMFWRWLVVRDRVRNRWVNLGAPRGPSVYTRVARIVALDEGAPNHMGGTKISLETISGMIVWVRSDAPASELLARIHKVECGADDWHAQKEIEQ